MTFELTRATKAKLTNVNLRAEHHGEELKTGMDLHLSTSLPNSFLDLLAPGLLESLYGPADADDTQPGLDGVDPVANLPRLRFPAMPEKFGYHLQLEDQVFELDYGIGGASSVKLEGVKVNKLVLTVKEGGTIIAGFRVQVPAGVLDETLLGRFGALSGHDVHALVYPQGETVNPLPFADAEPPKPKKTTRKTAADAGEIFAATHGTEA